MEYTLTITPNGAYNYKSKPGNYTVTADSYNIHNEVVTFFNFTIDHGSRETVSVASFGLRDSAYSITSEHVKNAAE